MPRRPAMLSQADIARSVRAAKQAGAGSVEITADGTIRILLDKPDGGPRYPQDELIEADHEIRL